MNYFVVANYSLYIFLFLFSLYSAFSQEAKLVSYDNNSLILEYKPELKSLTEISADGIVTVRPIIDNTTFDNAHSGSPANLYHLSNIAVPGQSDYSIVSVKVNGVKEIGSILAPVPTFEQIDNVAIEAYKINSDSYKAQIDDWFRLEYLGQSREINLASARFLAARYNPVKKVIEIPSSITVEIKFSKPLAFSKDLLASAVLNIRQLEKFAQKPEYQSPLFAKKSPRLQNLSDGSWYKIHVEQEGIYQITSSMLSEMDISIPNDKINSIKIFGNGGEELSEVVDDALNNKLREQDIIVKTKQDGSLESITFYGAPANGFKFNNNVYSHYINSYSVKNYYLLTWGGEPGQRAVEMPVPSEEPVNRPASFTKMIFQEEELVNPYLTGGGRVWLGKSYFAAPIITELPGLDRSGTVNYIISTAHKADMSGSFNITENGSQLMKIDLSGWQYQYGHGNRNAKQASFPAGKINGDNKSILKLDYDNIAGVGGTSSYLDYIEIFYPSYFIPTNNEIEFYSDSGWKGVSEFSINSFNGGEILGFDVTDRKSPKFLKNISSTGGMYKFKYYFEEPRRFFIASNRRAPLIEKINLANLRDDVNFTDAILITHKDLLESALKFKEYRESVSPIKIKIVTTENIYNEFASGVPDVTAIRDYLAYVYANAAGKTKYVILWGDGHYDYKGISTDKANYVPAYETPDIGSIFGRGDQFDETEMSCFDDFFVRVKGNDHLIDFAVGRINIENPGQGFAIIEKIKTYENNSSPDNWRSNILIVADDGINGTKTSGERMHTAQAEGIGNISPKDMQVKKLFLVAYPTEYTADGRRKPKAAEELVARVNNDGALLLSWIGHGNPRVWADEKIFEREKTIPLMVNKDKLFFLTAATCDFGRFDKVDVACGSEALLMSERGGAIGAFAATRLVFADQNHAINSSFYRELFTRIDGGFRNLGDVVFAVKQYTSGSIYNDQKFNLLGDPTLKLHVPDYNVKFEYVNDVKLDSNIAKLKALSPVKISGSIYDGAGNKMNGFNGILLMSMFDGDIALMKTDENGDIFNYTSYGGALNKGSFQVVNGEFTAEFIIPKDISFSEKTGRLFAYAYSNDNKFARGSMTNFIINDIEKDVIRDEEGPNISLFLETRDFIQGETVRANPLLIVDLSDNTAINATGLGIGHKIEAWIDDNPQSIDLTPKFNPAIGDNRSGSALENIFGLQPGTHTVKVRAWDVFNNYSLAETYFNIAQSNEIMIDDAVNFPNPFETGTTIRFKHNLQPPFNFEIGIFSSGGKLVREIKDIASSSYYSSVNWDGNDMSGAPVPAGAYYFVIKIDAAGKGSAVGKSSGSIKIK